jgi:hypothetical protein
MFLALNFSGPGTKAMLRKLSAVACDGARPRAQAKAEDERSTSMLMCLRKQDHAPRTVRYEKSLFTQKCHMLVKCETPIATYKNI